MNNLDYINLIFSASMIAIGDIILKVLGILSACVILGFNIWKWVKAAKADGKITKDEINELQETVVKGIDDIKESIPTENKEK